MQRWILPAVALAALTPVLAAAPAGKMKYSTGRITYSLNSARGKGTTSFAWVDSGKKFRQEMNARVTAQGKTMDINTWVIYDGQSVFMHNPMLGNSVQRMKVTPEMAKQLSGSMGMAAAPKNLGKVVGKGSVAGKACTIHAGPQGQGKIWMWESLPLKMEMGPQAGGMTVQATRVETGGTLSPSLFKVPAGMAVSEFKMPTRPPAGGKPAPK